MVVMTAKVQLANYAVQHAPYIRVGASTFQLIRRTQVGQIVKIIYSVQRLQLFETYEFNNILLLWKLSTDTRHRKPMRFHFTCICIFLFYSKRYLLRFIPQLFHTNLVRSLRYYYTRIIHGIRLKLIQLPDIKVYDIWEYYSLPTFYIFQVLLEWHFELLSLPALFYICIY